MILFNIPHNGPKSWRSVNFFLRPIIKTFLPDYAIANETKWGNERKAFNADYGALKAAAGWMELMLPHSSRPIRLASIQEFIEIQFGKVRTWSQKKKKKYGVDQLCSIFN